MYTFQSLKMFNECGYVYNSKLFIEYEFLVFVICILLLIVYTTMYLYHDLYLHHVNINNYWCNYSN